MAVCNARLPAAGGFAAGEGCGRDRESKSVVLVVEFAVCCRRFILPRVDASLKDSDGNSPLVACVQGKPVTRRSVRQHPGCPHLVCRDTLQATASKAARATSSFKSKPANLSSQPFILSKKITNALIALKCNVTCLPPPQLREQCGRLLVLSGCPLAHDAFGVSVAENAVRLNYSTEYVFCLLQ